MHELLDALDWTNLDDVSYEITVRLDDVHLDSMVAGESRCAADPHVQPPDRRFAGDDEQRVDKPPDAFQTWPPSSSSIHCTGHIDGRGEGWRRAPRWGTLEPDPRRRRQRWRSTSSG
jgi:hypothetical protein